VLKEIQVQGNISEFKGKRLAVDVRLIDSMAADVTDGIGLRVVAQRCIRLCGGDSQRQKDNQVSFCLCPLLGRRRYADRGRFVDYAMYRVRLLRHHGIEPYIVFDGGPLPAKKKTEVSREK
jgi:hypothetical protein